MFGQNIFPCESNQSECSKKDYCPRWRTLLHLFETVQRWSMGFFYVSTRYGDERRFQNKTKKIRKISVGNFRSERSQVPFVHRPFSITMDTSKRTYELPMTFPDRVVGLIYSLSNHNSSLTNLVEENGQNRKPQQLGTHYFTRPFIFSPAFLWLHARRTNISERGTTRSLSFRSLNQPEITTACKTYVSRFAISVMNEFSR